MNPRLARMTLTVVSAVLLGALTVTAGGLYLGLPLVALDLEASLTKVPIAVGDALDALETAVAGLGVPPSEWDEIQQAFDDALASVEAFAETFPMWVPLPLIGGGVEIGLPLVVVDGLRISGGMVSDELVRSIAAWGDLDIPRPLIDFEIDIGEETGTVLGDIDLSAWMLSTELVKRFDLLLLAVTLGAGVDLIGADVVPTVVFDVPEELEDGVTGALAALHLDGLSWSSFAAHATLGFEVGPPFLRLYGDVRWTMPLSTSTEWWELRAGPLSALIGFVIRF